MGKQRKINKKFVLLLLSLVCLEFVRGAYIISYLPIQGSLGTTISVAFVGIAVSVHYISDAIANFHAGFWMNRFGVSKIIGGCFLVALLALLAVPLFHYHLVILLIASILLGLSVCPLWIVVLEKASRGNRGENMGIVYLGWLTGLAGGSILMNYLMQFNVRRAYWILPIIACISWLLYYFSDGKTVYKVENKSFKKQVIQARDVLIRSRKMIPGTILQSIAAGMLIPILPSFVFQHLQFSYNMYTLLMLCIGAVAAIFMVPLGRVTDYFKPKWMFIGGFTIFAVGMVASLFVKSTPVIFAIAFLLAIAYTTFLPAWNAFVAENIPKGEHTVSWGIISSIQGVGTMLGPVIGGGLATFGASVSILVSALLFLLIAFIYIFIR
ncbi:MFS transporter [Bacillaceae bacterium Marseille-Q3522]|nr:MFS transporter [Bacillaceae bacterium Marseille-Q3522]